MKAKLNLLELKKQLALYGLNPAHWSIQTHGVKNKAPIIIENLTDKDICFSGFLSRENNKLIIKDLSLASV